LEGVLLDIQFVVFDLAGEQYGVEIDSIESIIKCQAVSKLPGTPHFLEGVTNLRGKVIPVLDLRKRIGLEAIPISSDSRIMVITTYNIRFGVIVDGVSEVVHIPEEQVEPVPGILSNGSTEFITGLAKWNDGLITLVNLGILLTHDEIHQVFVKDGEDKQL
jgi:purine-binding chemotaxis protein CheW